jgi:hypothetical protein
MRALFLLLLLFCGIAAADVTGPLTPLGGNSGAGLTSLTLTCPSWMTIAGTNPITTSGSIGCSTNFTPTGFTAARTYTFPDANATILTSNAAVTVAQGGTGAATLTGPLKGNGTAAISPSLAADIYALWSGTCSATTFLRGDGACAALNLATEVTGTLGVTNGGNGLATTTLGDLRYGSAANTLTALPGNTSTTLELFTQTGTGSASAAPVWESLATVGVPTLAGTTPFTAQQTVNLTGQTANTAVVGNLIENTTTASAGNQQEICQPLEGQGWGTTTPASVPVVIYSCIVPVQGTTAPTFNYVLYASINGSALTQISSLSYLGNQTLLGSAQASKFIVSGTVVPTYGIYAPSLALGFATNSLFAGDVDSTQHWRVGGTGVPTIASGACGATTNGTLSAAANDHAGEIIIGAATTTTCAVTFSSSYATAPRAVLLTPAVGTVAPTVSALSASGFTIAATALASTSFYYWVQ